MTKMSFTNLINSNWTQGDLNLKIIPSVELELTSILNQHAAIDQFKSKKVLSSSQAIFDAQYYSKRTVQKFGECENIMKSNLFQFINGFQFKSEFQPHLQEGNECCCVDQFQFMLVGLTSLHLSWDPQHFWTLAYARLLIR